MTSLLVPLLLGLGVALGCIGLVRGYTLRRASLESALMGLTESNWPTVEHDRDDLFARVARAIAPATGASLDSDLALLGRSAETHAVDKLRTALFWGVMPAAFAMVGRLGLFRIAPVMVLLATLVMLAGGWFLADHQVHQRATARRREFRSTLVSYLQLVTILLAGGAGVNQALSEAASYGQGWSFEIIKQSLHDSTTRNVSPWEGFAQVGAEFDLRHLHELSGAMRLAGESGAHVRQGLLAKAESLRIHELTQIETEAVAASEQMGGPVGGMVIGFVITMGYPAFASILAL